MTAMIDVGIAHGSHERIARKVGEFSVHVIDGPEIELVASFLPEPEIQNSAHLQATTRAIHMDPEVAAALFVSLRETFEAMGWPLPPEGAGQASAQQLVTDGPHQTPRHTRVLLSPQRFPRSR